MLKSCNLSNSRSGSNSMLASLSFCDSFRACCTSLPVIINSSIAPPPLFLPSPRLIADATLRGLLKLVFWLRGTGISADSTLILRPVDYYNSGGGATGCLLRCLRSGDLSAKEGSFSCFLIWWCLNVGEVAFSEGCYYCIYYWFIDVLGNKWSWLATTDDIAADSAKGKACNIT